MRLTGFSIKHHVAVLLLCVGLVVIGLACYFTMSRESFPDVDLPYVIVSTFLDGATPTDIEKSVTIPLETELDGVEGVKEMSSASMDSFSMISLEFQPDVTTEEALRRVRDAVDQAKPDISTEAEEPVVKEFSTSSFPVIAYHLVAAADSKVSLSELDELADKLEDEIKVASGVLDVDVFGTREREVVIEIDPDRLHFYKLSLDQVKGVLLGSNRNVSAGTADGDTSRIVMRVPGEFREVGEIFGLVVGYSAEGGPIYMRDVAMPRYDFEDEISRARLFDFTEDSFTGERGSPSITLQVKKRAGANVLDMNREIDARIARMPIPETIRIVKGLDMSKDVTQMVGDLENGIGTSLILVLAVIFIGLGLRNAILVATAIPFSMLMAIIILKVCGQTLNMMILFGLILSLGMLVDNAIVIVENIYRHLSLGTPRLKAAFEGTSEVAWPVIASTATTVGAFLPLMFWPGIMGDFMSYLPLTVIVVLSCSLFVALVINPTLSSLLMRRKKGVQNIADPEFERPTYWLVRHYQPVLEFFLDHRGWTLCAFVSLFIFVCTFYATFNNGVELFPPTDPDNATCSIRPPEGTSLDQSEHLCRQAEARLFGLNGSGYDKPVQNLKYASVVVGLEGVGDAGGGALAEDNSGPVKIQMEFVDREFRTQRTKETLQEMRQRLEGLDKKGRRIAPPLYGADFDILEPREGPPTGSPVSIDIFGDDLNEMSRVVGDMKNIIKTIPGTVKPTDDAVTAQPTLEWTVDRARAGMLGLDQATIASLLQISVGGLQTGTFGHGDDEQDIMLRMPKRYRLDTSLLENITIPTPNGGAVPLTSVAHADLVPGPVTIKHIDKRRVLNASADVQPGIRQDASIRAAFQNAVATYSFPPGISYRFGGAAEDQQEASVFLGKAFMMAIFLILMVLVLQFNCLSKSGIVMGSVVMSLIGVLLGLLAIRAPFGIIMTGIGIISLAGVVVNNAIVLLDAIAQYEGRGQSPREATISAVMIRFRPVLLTAITTILGLIPMALKLNWDFRAMAWQFDTKSSQWWQSMSLTVIFGLLVATILTLGLVPTLYLQTAERRERRALRRERKNKDG